MKLFFMNVYIGIYIGIYINVKLKFYVKFMFIINLLCKFERRKI